MAKQYSAPPPMTIDPNKTYTATMETSLGTIKLELDPKSAPGHVNSFVFLSREGYYDGVIFHRVIDNFMVQTGGFDEKMVEKKSRAPIQHEGRAALAKGLKNQVGTLAMARTGDPHSASAQFFINVKDNAFLDPTAIPPGDPVPRFEYQGRVYENVPRSQLESAPQLYGYTVFGKVVSGMDVVNKIKAVPTGQHGMHGDVPKTPVVVTSATLVK